MRRNNQVLSFTSNASQLDDEAFAEVNSTIQKMSDSNRALNVDVKRILENKQRLENENFMLSKEIGRLKQANQKYVKPMRNAASNLTLEAYEDGPGANTRSAAAIKRIHMDSLPVGPSSTSSLDATLARQQESSSTITLPNIYVSPSLERE